MSLKNPRIGLPALLFFGLSLFLGAPATGADVVNARTHPSPRPYLMAVMGNSLSAGAFAWFPGPGYWDPEREPREPTPFAGIIESKRTLSWASGIHIDSHYVKLKAHLEESGDPIPLHVINFAQSGSRTTHMPEQARRIVREMREGRHHSLKYVTLLIGSNDLCRRDRDLHPFPEQRMREGLLGALEELASIRQEEPIRVLLSGVPNIADLGKPEISRTKTAFGYTCHRLRDRIFRSCSNLVYWKTPDEYARNVGIVERLNALFRWVVLEAEARFPNLDVVYGASLEKLQVDADILSFDCFHPNWRGQEGISHLLWRDQPWFH